MRAAVPIPGRRAVLGWLILLLVSSAGAEPFLVVPALPVHALPAGRASTVRGVPMLSPVPGTELLAVARTWGVLVTRGAPGTDLGSALAAASVRLPGTSTRAAVTVGQWGTWFYREQRVALALEGPGSRSLGGGVVLEGRRVALDAADGRAALGVGVHATSVVGAMAARVRLHPVAVVGSRSLHPVRWGVAVGARAEAIHAAIEVGGVAASLDARIVTGATGPSWGAAIALDVGTGAVRAWLGLGPGPVGVVGVDTQRDLGTGSGVAVIGGAR